jgi:hypothetical protein
MTNLKPVAVLVISDDANEDEWMQALWHGQLAAKEAAIDSGIAEDDIRLSADINGRVAIASGGGRTFESWIFTSRSVPKFTYGKRVDPEGYVRPSFARRPTDS